MLHVWIPRSRLYTSDNWIFMTWMVGIALVTGAVSLMFLKNQLRSLRRLAVAADAFGKGRDMPEAPSETFHGWWREHRGQARMSP